MVFSGRSLDDAAPAAHIALAHGVAARRRHRAVLMQAQGHRPSRGGLDHILPDVHRALSIRCISCGHSGPVCFHTHRVARPGGKGGDILPVSHIQLAGMVRAAARDGPIRFPGEQMPARRGKTVCRRLRLYLFFRQLLSGKLFQRFPVHGGLPGRSRASLRVPVQRASVRSARASGCPGSVLSRACRAACGPRSGRSDTVRARRSPCRKLRPARKDCLQDPPEKKACAQRSGRRSYADIEPLLLFRKLFPAADLTPARAVQPLHQLVHALVAVLHPDGHSLIQKGIGCLRGNLAAQLLKFLQGVLMQPVHGSRRHLSRHHPVHGGADGVHVRPWPLVPAALILLRRGVAVL